MELKTRRIGPIGTATRLAAAAGLLYLALFDGTRWGLEWCDAAIGLAVLPAALTRVWTRGAPLRERPRAVHRPGRCRRQLRAHRRARSQSVHGGWGRALLRDDAFRRCLARPAGLRGDRPLKRDLPPRRPARLPGLLADRPRRGAPRDANRSAQPPSRSRAILARELVTLGSRPGRSARRPCSAASISYKRFARNLTVTLRRWSARSGSPTLFGRIPGGAGSASIASLLTKSSICVERAPCSSHTREVRGADPLLWRRRHTTPAPRHS
jgi:hypothetical protein